MQNRGIRGKPGSVRAERLYREQGVNTMLLLGHTRQSMTDLYNKNRGKANPQR